MIYNWVDYLGCVYIDGGQVRMGVPLPLSIEGQCTKAPEIIRMLKNAVKLGGGEPMRLYAQVIGVMVSMIF